MAASFTDAPISRADFTSVIDAAEKGGLIERHKGQYQRFDFGNGVGAGKVTRFRALPTLMAFAAERGLDSQNVDEHFTRQATEPPKQVLVLRGSSSRQGQGKVKGSDLPYEQTAENRSPQR